ncbi:MAG: M1 family metallopeptidase [Ignavibacteriae bacterium]|nr:M1 family metallopeptidase [Ignavibacteriota bacterium]
MNRFLLLAALVIVMIYPASAQFFHTETHYTEPFAEPREHPIDIKRMTVDVSFDAPKGIVKGKVTHVFTPLQRKVDSIFFDAIKITISSATLNGKSVRFVSTDTSVMVYPSPALSWGTTDSIIFIYEVTPRKGLYFISWNADVASTKENGAARKQIWTQGQGIDNRAWIPMYDEMNDKFITETIVTFDKEYEVLSNGTKLSEKDNGNGTKTWHYTMTHPHAGYLLMLGIGKYAIDNRTSKSGVPVRLWYYPEFQERMIPTYRYSTEAIDFLEEQTGIKYPWESYSQIPVEEFTFGAMENTTATVFGDFSQVDERGFLDRSYVGTNVHELTHQWFGDFITARSGKGTWLQESFATYYPTIFTRKYYGEDAYQWSRRGAQNAAISASEKDRLPIVHTQAGTSRVYPKGSGVIDMMNYVFGEEEFKRVINHYLTHHAYGNVETNDIYLSFQDVLGFTPNWFFDEWLYRGGEPHYKVSWDDVRSSKSGRETQITVAQIQPRDELSGLFKMPVEFEVHYADGSSDHKREWIEKEQHTVTIPNNNSKDVAYVLFDPASHIMKQLTFKKLFSELKAQVLNAPNMIDRYDALVGLKSDSSDIAAKQTVLSQVFDKEKYSVMRSEVVSQLSGEKTATAYAVLHKAFKDRDVDVRKSALNGVKGVPVEFQKDVEGMLKDSSYAVVATALEKLSDVYPQNIPTYLETTKNELGMYNQVKIKWLEISVAAGTPVAADSKEKLIRYSSSSYEFWTRRNAMNALKRVNYCDDKVIDNLVDGMFNPCGRLSGPASDVLTYFYQQSQYKQKIMKYYNSKEWKGWQKDMFDKVVK